MKIGSDASTISHPCLSQIERGLREPSGRVVDAIARSLAMRSTSSTRRPGIVPEIDDDAGVRTALEADCGLTPRQR